MKKERKESDKISIIIFVDRMDLGASIDSIHKGKIKPTDLEKETVEFIMDNIDNLEIENLEELDDLDDDAKKEMAINKFLEDGIIWGRNYNSHLAILEFNMEAIKGVK